MTLPQKRYNVFARVDYDINDHAEVYTDFLFTQYESASGTCGIARAAATTGFRVPVSNPFITPELARVLATRAQPRSASFLLNKRFTALGAASFGAELYDVYQITTGIKGEIGLSGLDL